MNRRQLATKIAWHFLGTPYVWGGDDPMQGFDCSGFVIEILKSVGVLPRKGDWTANGLWQHFREAISVHEGSLVFWENKSKSKMIHVEYCLDSKHSIGASGGGSSTWTVEDAIKRNAYVKIRPIRSRANIAGFVNPFNSEVL